MDPIQARFEALEQRTHTIERQLRWWRGVACGLIVLALLTWALPLGTAQENTSPGGNRGLAQRLADLEHKLQHLSSASAEDGRPEMVITGANLRIVNGLGQTDCGPQDDPIPDCPNGLGNLIVGYNELRGGENIRTGSHNVVVGQFHNFSRVGGVVVGERNEISGEFAAVSGGTNNTASGDFASVSGGNGNRASGGASSVSGGGINTARGIQSSVSGVAGNRASGGASSVSGGNSNTASGFNASVSGGLNRTAEREFDWVAGPLFADE
jgi:hypothetical protein